MAQNEPQRKETPPGPSPNSPSLLFECQCTSGKFIRLANRIEKIDSVARIESNRNFFARIGMLYSRAHVKIASRMVSYRTLRTSGFMELCRQRPGV